jgi:hypothetical protein
MAKVEFDTTYCVKTQEEIDAILKEVGRIFLYYYKKQLLEEMQTETAD